MICRRSWGMLHRNPIGHLAHRPKESLFPFPEETPWEWENLNKLILLKYLNYGIIFVAYKASKMILIRKTR